MADNEAQGTHFFFLAITGPGGYRSESFGTMTPDPRDTQHSIFEMLRQTVLEKCPTGCFVSSFSFGPNRVVG